MGKKEILNKMRIGKIMEKWWYLLEWEKRKVQWEHGNIRGFMEWEKDIHEGKEFCENGGIIAGKDIIRVVFLCSCENSMRMKRVFLYRVVREKLSDLNWIEKDIIRMTIIE